MMYDSQRAWIVRRIPGPGTGTDTDMMQDNLGRWWQYDRSATSTQTATTVRAVIDRDGYIHPKT